MKPSKILSAALACSYFAPIAAEYEWAGTFASNDSKHHWIAQKVGGSYVDPTMRIVFYAISDPSSQESIEQHEDDAGALIDSDDGSCIDVTSGQTIDPAVKPCYTLTFDQSSPDSKYIINTEGLTGFVAFAQHVPIEFERDQHYLQDSAGNDVEPVLEEGADGHDHSHGHDDHGHEIAKGESCACAAEEFNFNIDCTAKAAMLDSLALLKNAGCAADCSSSACETAYLIVQAHHDYCPEEQVPTEVEDGFHDYDEKCVACEIERSYTAGAVDCPAPNCDDKSGDVAYGALVEGGCMTDCSSDACRDNFFILRVTHDQCPHDTLSRASEEGLHDLEVPCAKQLCNAAGAEKSVPVCDHDSHDGHADSGAATAAITGVAATFIGAALVM